MLSPQFQRNVEKKECKLLSGKALSAKVCFVPEATLPPVVRRDLKTEVGSRGLVRQCKRGCSDQRVFLVDLRGAHWLPCFPRSGVQPLQHRLVKPSYLVKPACQKIPSPVT